MLSANQLTRLSASLHQYFPDGLGMNEIVRAYDENDTLDIMSELKLIYLKLELISSLKMKDYNLVKVYELSLRTLQLMAEVNEGRSAEARGYAHEIIMLLAEHSSHLPVETHDRLNSLLTRYSLSRRMAGLT